MISSNFNIDVFKTGEKLFNKKDSGLVIEEALGIQDITTYMFGAYLHSESFVKLDVRERENAVFVQNYFVCLLIELIQSAMSDDFDGSLNIGQEILDRAVDFEVYEQTMKLLSDVYDEFVVVEYSKGQEEKLDRRFQNVRGFFTNLITECYKFSVTAEQEKVLA